MATDQFFQAPGMGYTGRIERVGSVVLGPCKRTGDPANDWWQVQHVDCMALDIIVEAAGSTPGKALVCSCPCHTDPASPQGLARLAAEAYLAETRQEGGNAAGQ